MVMCIVQSFSILNVLLYRTILQFSQESYTTNNICFKLQDINNLKVHLQVSRYKGLKINLRTEQLG